MQEAESEETEPNFPPRIQVVQDILQCLFALAQAQGDVDGRIDAPLEVVTTQGNIRPAAECYLGPEYPSGELLHSLYGPLGADEFVAGAPTLGLTDSPELVERFLRRIGVAAIPRRVPVQDGYGFRGFVKHILAQLEYPNNIFDRTTQSLDEALAILCVYFDGVDMPDRFDRILTTSEPEAISAYVWLYGRDHLDASRRLGARFKATQGRQWTPREYSAVPVPDLVHYLLRTSAWVTCDDGARRTPDRIILSKIGRRVLNGIYFNHHFNKKHQLLEGSGAKNAVEHILQQLGALYSLDSLKADDLYQLLLSLPSRDTQGRHASGIYRALVEGRWNRYGFPTAGRIHPGRKDAGTTRRKGGLFFDLRAALRSSVCLAFTCSSPYSARCD